MNQWTPAQRLLRPKNSLQSRRKKNPQKRHSSANNTMNRHDGMTTVVCEWARGISFFYWICAHTHTLIVCGKSVVTASNIGAVRRYILRDYDSHALIFTCTEYVHRTRLCMRMALKCPVSIADSPIRTQYSLECIHNLCTKHWHIILCKNRNAKNYNWLNVKIECWNSIENKLKKIFGWV